ncbi:MAG TPA: hypothetical protein PLD73_13530 [Candidatus Hydrogenedentes bacterium]|jgi:hypothetical protein|nr:hypothetical protein [Candidatus Hydrogenedentota bacterium]HPJ98015.1 hypothetical protein [Candidatus Hydrogenedentota bacterium]
MSDALRTFQGPVRGRWSSTRRGRRRRGIPFKRFFFVVLLLLAGAGYWISRDTHAVHSLIPSTQKYSVVLRDILRNRAELAGSAIWDALPPESGSGKITQVLRGELGLPEWMARNIIVDDCYISGNDLRDFNDVLFVTKMTRIGTLIEQLHWVTSRIGRDTAGGLGLRHFPAAGVYYAVRGRILLISPSRDALVNALTLQDDGRLTEAAFDQDFEKIAGEDIGGTVTFALDDPLGEILEDIRFCLRIDQTQAHLNWNARLRAEQHARLAPLLSGVSPGTLLIPPPGLVAVSGNLNKPLGEVWRALDGSFNCGGGPGLVSETGEIPEENWPKEGPPSLAQLLEMILGPLGPGWRIALQGVDLNEWFPVPIFAGTFDLPQGTASDFLAQLPPPPGDAMVWESYPRYDAAAGMLRVPMIAGPSLEPTAAPYGESLLVCSSASLAEDILAAEPALRPLEQPGNFYIRLQPSACARAINETLELLVRGNILKEQAVRDFHAAFDAWLYGAARVSEAAGLLAYEDGGLTADLVVICAPAL